MNINCNNCSQILNKYLSDIPSNWRHQIVSVICNSMQLDCNDPCEDVKNCIHTAELSAFTRTGDYISITYTNEKNEEFTSTFNFEQLFDNSLDDIDPKCIMSQEEWDELGYEERIQAVLDYRCQCCPTTTTTTTSTTTTTTIPRATFELHNYTSIADPIPVVFYDETIPPGDNPYVFANETSGGEDLYADYPCESNESRIKVFFGTHALDVTVLVNGSVFYNNNGYLGELTIIDIPACASVVVIITDTNNTTTTTSTSTTTTNTTSTTSTSSTTTNTTQPPVFPSTTTTTTACPNVSEVVMEGEAGLTTTTSTTTSTSSTSSTTTTTTEGTTTSTTTTTTLCECDEGYTLNAEGNVCYRVESVEAIPPTSPQESIARTNKSYSTLGSWIYDPSYNVNGTGTATQIPLTNTFWYNGTGTGPDGNTIDGPMNRAALWSGTIVSDQDIGFGVCITAPTTKTYYIGIGCDNYGVITVDGVIVVEQDEAAINAQYSGFLGSPFKAFHIYPVQLSAGPHILEIYGHNVSGVAGVAIEVYDNSAAEIAAATSYLELNLVFSSKDEIGQPIHYGTEGAGYTCPEGYSVNGCNDPIVCTRVIYLDCGEVGPITTTTTTTTTTTSTTTTTTGTTTSTTTTTTATPPPEMCVDCEPTIALSSPEFSTIAAGVVTSALCTVGDYVIDWFKDAIFGDPAFTSGTEGADPSVTVNHPFSGEIVQGGTWYPAIRFIYLDGIKYSTVPMEGAILAPDLLACLGSQVVTSLNCDNGGTLTSPYTGALAPYSHVLVYTNSVTSSTLASRSFRFDLDGSPYFAWQFVGFSVSDKVKVSYVSPTNVTDVEIDEWSVGSELSTSNVSSDPQVWNRAFIAKISNLTGFTFAAGDYLRVDITPSSNSNTNWSFYCKCLDVIDCDIVDSTVRQIVPGSVNMTYDSTNCLYKLNYQKPTYIVPTGSELWNYHTWEPVFYYTTDTVGYFPQFADVSLHLRHRTDAGAGATALYYQCADLAVNANFSKVADTITMQFNNLSDYNSHKNSFTAARDHANMLGTYSSDPTNFHHYKFYIIHIINAVTCGDTKTDYYYYLHYSNPPVFNDGAMTMTINLQTVTNSYVKTTCNFMYETIQGIVNTVNSQVGSADLSFTTGTRGATSPVTGLYYYQIVGAEVDKRFAFFYRNPSVDVCDMPSKGWSNISDGTYSEWSFRIIDDRVVITDTGNPIDNFELWRAMNVADGIPEISQVDFYLIYKKVGGSVTVDNITAYNSGTL